MKRAAIYSNNIFAGVLTEYDNLSYSFEYDTQYLNNTSTSAISLTLPKRVEPYVSDTLFPFFFNMLSEGDNRAIQTKKLHIDEDDNFELLLATATTDTIGAITVKRL